MFKKYLLLSIFLIAVLICAGCVEEPEISTTPITSTPSPTETQTPASTSTPAPTPKPTITPERGSYENPASMQEKVTVKYGETRIEITVLTVERGESVWNELYETNMFNDEPKQGFEYLLAKIRVEYLLGESSKYVSAFDFKAYADGVGYSSTLVVSPKDRPELESVELMPGGKTEGWVYFEVPQNTPVLIAYEYLFEPSCFIDVGA